MNFEDRWKRKKETDRKTEKLTTRIFFNFGKKSDCVVNPNEKA